MKAPETEEAEVGRAFCWVMAAVVVVDLAILWVLLAW